MKKATAALLGILLLAGCSDGVTQEQGMKNQACKNLAKIKGIDDLLFQMHSNLDSYCLFEMPTEELERIGGSRCWILPIQSMTKGLMLLIASILYMSGDMMIMNKNRKGSLSLA